MWRHRRGASRCCWDCKARAPAGVFFVPRDPLLGLFPVRDYRLSLAMILVFFIEDKRQQFSIEGSASLVISLAALVPAAAQSARPCALHGSLKLLTSKFCHRSPLNKLHPLFPSNNQRVPLTSMAHLVTNHSSEPHDNGILPSRECLRHVPGKHEGLHLVLELTALGTTETARQGK
jgi:hypothetical protein